MSSRCIKQRQCNGNRIEKRLEMNKQDEEKIENNKVKKEKGQEKVKLN